MYKQTLFKQIEYLKSINLYDLTIQRILEYGSWEGEDCSSIVDYFDWTETPEGGDFWSDHHAVIRNTIGTFKRTSCTKILHSIFPKQKYPHLYI